MTKPCKTAWCTESADGQLISEKVDAESASKDGPSHVEDTATGLLRECPVGDHGKEIGCISEEGGENTSTIGASSKELSSNSQHGSQHASSTSSSLSSQSKPNSCSKKVAFVSIKNPKLSTQTMPRQGVFPLAATFNERSNETKKDDEGGTLTTLLTDGIAKDSVF